MQIFIRNRPNNALVRFPCIFCGGCTEKQDYLFETPDGTIMCDDCAEHAECIPVRMQEHARRLRERADELEEKSQYEYVAEVVPAPNEDEYSDESFAGWMRERLGLPARRHDPADAF